MDKGRKRDGMTVIFKGSNRCNAGCTFCSVGIPGARIIADEEFDLVADQLDELVAARGIRKLEFTFHGGEPTLLGAAFIERCCERVKKIGTEVGFSMQSNLLHWDDEMVDVLRRYEVRVGTSMDPLGAGRLDGEGNDAYPRWLDSYLRLTAEGFSIGAIFVVTRAALGRAKRLYEIAEGIGRAKGEAGPFGLQINPVYAQGKAASEASILISPREFGEFMVDLWRIWDGSGRTVNITPIKSFAEIIEDPIEGVRSLSCSFTGDCSRSHVGIDFNLDVAGCGRRLDSHAVLGNLREAGLVEILDTSEEKRRISRRAELLSAGACADCRFFPICHGGCPDDATLMGGEVDHRFGWCESYRMLFEAIEAKAGTRFVQGMIHVCAAVEPSAMGEAVLGTGSKEAWVMPRADGSNLRFESGLQEIGEARNTRIKLWVNNRNVRYLALWERLLRRKNVSVVLFEGGDLLETASYLNDLGAHIILDMVSLAGDDAFDDLEAILERFVFDSEWGSQVSPFDHMLLSVVRQSPPVFMNWLGMKPGTFHASDRCLEEEAPPMAGRLLKWLEAEAQPLGAWLEVRKPCTDCPSVAACGASMVRGDGDPCHPKARALVERISSVGEEMRRQMKR